MSDDFVDTNVILRLVVGDDAAKQTASEALFQRVEAGELNLLAPETVIADAVFVLASPRHYGFSRSLIREKLAPLVELPHFHVSNKRVISRALEIFAATTIDFGDAMLVAAIEVRGGGVLYSYDRDFDRFVNITRREP